MNRSRTSLLLGLLCSLLWLSTSLFGCNQPSPRPLDAQQLWLKQHALVLNTTDPNAPLDDLLPLQPLVGTASIVGLGEATHGSHEFFTMKQRLLEFLAQHMGFTLFAMEGSWSAGEKINAYVLYGQGEAADVLQQFHFWTWNTQEVLALLQWLRAYDADPAHQQKVAFAGFDCQYIEPNTNPGKGLLWIAAGILWFVGALGYRHLLQGRPINLHLGFGTWLNMVMLAGFIEEIPLRGVVFQKLNESLNFWSAGSISSFVFVCLHFPYWISIGVPLSSFLIASLSIFVLALFLCFVLKRSGSLWADIVIHGLNNLLSLLV